MWLAIDTSTKWSLLALRDGGQVKERRFEPRATQRVIFAELANLLDPDILQDLDGIVVGIGPGSFTGVKIGVIAAKTLAWSREIPIIGAGSLDVIAAGMNPPDDPAVKLAVAVPSTRGEAYVRLYESKDGKWQETGPIMDISLSSDRLEDQFPEDTLLVSGESAELLTEALSGKRQVTPADEKFWFPTAKGLFELVDGRIQDGDFDDALTLVPQYIRPSQPERLEKEGRR